MKPRFTPWLAAALLLAAASVGVPCTRSAEARLQSAIVWIDKSRHAEEEVLEAREPAKYPAPRVCTKTVAAAPVGRSAILSDSLFQRPPPKALLARS